MQKVSSVALFYNTCAVAVVVNAVAASTPAMAAVGGSIIFAVAYAGVVTVAAAVAWAVDTSGSAVVSVLLLF